MQKMWFNACICVSKYVGSKFIEDGIVLNKFLSELNQPKIPSVNLIWFYLLISFLGY